MDELFELAKIDFSSLFISIFIVLIGMKTIVSLFEWIIDQLGLETKWMRKKREDHELLIRTSENLIELQEQHKKDVEYSDKQDEKLRDDIKKITDIIIDKQISDYRWEILSMSSNLSNGKKYNRETFDHIFTIYQKYEKILEENNMTNGLIDESIKYIKEVYHKEMDNKERCRRDFDFE